MKKQWTDSAVPVATSDRSGFTPADPIVTRKTRVEYRSEADVFSALESDGALYIRKEDVTRITVTERVITHFYPRKG